MLYVETKIGKKIGVLDYSKSELEQMRTEKFYCPGCHQAVRLKNGPILSAHFAHISGDVCESFSEGETEEHLKGKKIIAEWCERSSIPYELEAYLPKLKQRPDLLIDKRLAIEFQCSPLSLERFKERTEGYLSNGYEVIWVLGRRYFLGERLATLQKAAMTYHVNRGLVVWQLDIEKQEMICNYNIQRQLVTGKLFYNKTIFRVDKIDSQTLTHYMMSMTKPKTIQFSKSELNEVRLELIRKLVRKDSQLLKVQSACYKEFFLLQTIADECFYPLVSSPVLGDEILYLRALYGGGISTNVWYDCLINRPELLKRLEGFPSLVLRDPNKVYDYLEF